jgi:hypothetical protein
MSFIFTAVQCCDSCFTQELMQLVTNTILVLICMHLEIKAITDLMAMEREKNQEEESSTFELAR